MTPTITSVMQTIIVNELAITDKTLKSIQSNSPCLFPLKKATHIDNKIKA